MTAAAAKLLDREALAQQMASTTAQHLTFAVQQRDPAMVEQLLLPLSRQELITLAVVLADQAPAARSRPEDGLIDDIAVERAAKGERVPLTKAERDRAIRRMDRRGVAWRVIAEQFGVSVKTVKRALVEPRPVQAAITEVRSTRGAAGETSGGEVA
jgi:DNA-binding NarL/FixJ family response regulator